MKLGKKLSRDHLGDLIFSGKFANEDGTLNYSFHFIYEPKKGIQTKTVLILNKYSNIILN